MSWNVKECHGMLWNVMDMQYASEHSHIFTHGFSEVVQRYTAPLVQVRFFRCEIRSQRSALQSFFLDSNGKIFQNGNGDLVNSDG